MEKDEEVKTAPECVSDSNRPGLTGQWSLDRSTNIYETLQFGLFGKLREPGSKLLHFPKIRVKQLKYPKKLNDVLHTALFQGDVLEENMANIDVGQSAMFRLEDPYRPTFENTNGNNNNNTNTNNKYNKGDVWASPSNALHSFASRTKLFMSSCSRMPGLDPNLHYEIFCYKHSQTAYENNMDEDGDDDDDATAYRPGAPAGDVYVIVHAFIVGADKGRLALVFNKNSGGGREIEASEKAFQTFRGAAYNSIEERIAMRTFLDSLGKKNNPLKFQMDSQPIYRILRCPLAFNLWPQKQLMQMSFKAFNTLADALEDARWWPIYFCFAWLMPEGTSKLSPLRSDELCLMQRLLGFPKLFNDEENNFLPLRHALLCEVIQRGLEEGRRAGHTFITEEMMATYYVKSCTTEHAQFTLKTIIMNSDEDKVVSFNDPTVKGFDTAGILTNIIKAYKLIQIGIKYRLIHVVGERDRFAPSKLMRSIYLYEDWIKQRQFITFMETVTSRWNRDLHADGCKNAREVASRIANPPPKPAGGYPVGAPQWRNPAFKLQFAKLDEHQKEAVYRAVLQAISVIGGPPGTGKTEVFKTLFHLFGGAGKSSGAVVPFAAYGRIAAMLRDRLNGIGYTFHRASMTCVFQGEEEEGKMLKNASTWLWDEAGLITHHHTSLMIASGSEKVTRLVMAGDPDQMDAIGSGAFFDSLVHQVRYKEAIEGCPRFTLLKIQWRFMTTPEEIADINNNRRPTPDKDRAIDWNMKQLLTPRRNEHGAFDLSYSNKVNDKKARFIMLKAGGPGGVNSRWVNSILEAKLGSEILSVENESAATLHARGIQFITQRHADCAEINKHVVSALFPSLRDQKFRPLRRFERVCCTKNGYFTPTEDPTVGSNGFVSDTELERLALASTMEQEQNHGRPRNAGGDAIAALAMPAGEDFMDIDGMADDSIASRIEGEATSSNSSLKRRRQERTDMYRTTSSDDVFNGDIKMIKKIVDVSRATGSVVAEFSHIKEGRGNFGGKKPFRDREQVARIIIFHDDTQLNITDHYDMNMIDRAYCITSKKMQGSQAKTIVNYLTPASGYDLDEQLVTAKTLHCEELYTNMTRAEDDFFCVLPMAEAHETEMLDALRNIALHKAPITNNSFGARMPVFLPVTP